MKLIARTLAGLAGVAMLAATADAQVTTTGTWQSMTTPSNSGTPFWDNPSEDNTNCNVGYYLVYGYSAGYGPCLRQHPSDAYVQANAGLLGMTGSTPNGAYLSRAPFSFAAGQYTFQLLANIAGLTSPTQYLGVFKTDGTLISQLWTWGSPMPTTPTTINIADEWVLGAINMTSYSTVYSNAPTDTRFALFSNSPAASAGGQYQNYYVGFDDYANKPVGDADYQDIVLSISSVPEPSSVALMAVGLSAMAAVARRRRRA